jgi:serine/threonine protein kinase
VIERDGTLDLNRALDYTCQICNAMDHAHSQGIIHRDLRPGNVLVTDQGMVKVADFGTSRFLEIAAHGTTVIGSPPYMAPEQFQGKAVFASDIYSLGVTMYQMFTGVLPYDTPMPADLEKLMKGELATPPKLKNPKLPKAISDIVMRAIAADIPSRYQRASDLLEAVLAARTPAPATVKRPWRPAPVSTTAPSEEVQEIQARLKARETVQAKFCWKCGKALPARADVCPFCSERQ